MPTITDETAGIDEAHIRSVSEIMAQEKLEAEQEKNKPGSLKSVASKAKGMYYKLDSMSNNVNNIKSKLNTMSDLFGKDTELGLMFASLSSDIMSLKDDSKDIETNVSKGLSDDKTESKSIAKVDDKTESKSVGKVADENGSKSIKGFNGDKKSKEELNSTKNSIYVPSSDTLNDVSKRAKESRANGGKGKILKYTSDQMSMMSKEDLGNVIKSGFAADMKSSPVVSFLKSQVGFAEAAAIAEPVAKVVKRVKKLPDIRKPDVAFMGKSLNIDAPNFNANDYIVTDKDTSKLYESAVDYGDMFFNIDQRQGLVPDENVAEHITAEERQALRDAKYGKADANVNYNQDNDYSLSGPGGKF